jgi:hypothetical protein
MERMNLTLDIRPNEIGPRRVNVRSSLLVANLIADVQDKFNLDGTLELRLAEGADPLRLDRPLEPQGVADGGTLICDRLMEDTGTMDAIARGAGLLRRAVPAGLPAAHRTSTTWPGAGHPGAQGSRPSRTSYSVDLEGWRICRPCPASRLHRCGADPSSSRPSGPQSHLPGRLAVETRDSLPALGRLGDRSAAPR